MWECTRFTWLDSTTRISRCRSYPRLALTAVLHLSEVDGETDEHSCTWLIR